MAVARAGSQAVAWFCVSVCERGKPEKMVNTVPYSPPAARNQKPPEVVVVEQLSNFFLPSNLLHVSDCCSPRQSGSLELGILPPFVFEICAWTRCENTLNFQKNTNTFEKVLRKTGEWCIRL